MAEQKFVDVPKSSSFVSSKYFVWDPKDARKLVEESESLRPRPTVIFVRPAPELSSLDFKGRESNSHAMSGSANAANAPPQGRMGRIKVREEGSKEFIGTELSRKQREITSRIHERNNLRVHFLLLQLSSNETKPQAFSVFFLFGAGNSTRLGKKNGML